MPLKDIITKLLRGGIAPQEYDPSRPTEFHISQEAYLPFFVGALNDQFDHYTQKTMLAAFKEGIDGLLSKYSHYAILSPFYGLPTAVDQIHLLFPYAPKLPAKIVGIEKRAHEYINLFYKYQGFGRNHFEWIDDSDSTKVEMLYKQVHVPLTLHQGDSLDILNCNTRQSLLGNDQVGLVTILSGIEPYYKRETANELAYLQTMTNRITALSEQGDILILNAPMWPYYSIQESIKASFKLKSETEFNALWVKT